MPILLDTPKIFDPGHGQAEESYTLVTIVKFDLRIVDRMVIFTMQYGNVNAEGNWMKGKLPEGKIIVEDRQEVYGNGIDPADGIFKQMISEPEVTDFTDMAAELLVEQSHVGIPFLSSLGSELYQYFIDDGHYEGTVV